MKTQKLSVSMVMLLSLALAVPAMASNAIMVIARPDEDPCDLHPEWPACGGSCDAGGSNCTGQGESFAGYWLNKPSAPEINQEMVLKLAELPDGNPTTGLKDFGNGILVQWNIAAAQQVDPFTGRVVEAMTSGVPGLVIQDVWFDVQGLSFYYLSTDGRIWKQQYPKLEIPKVAYDPGFPAGTKGWAFQALQSLSENVNFLIEVEESGAYQSYFCQLMSGSSTPPMAYGDPNPSPTIAASASPDPTHLAVVVRANATIEAMKRDWQVGVLGTLPETPSAAELRLDATGLTVTAVTADGRVYAGDALAGTASLVGTGDLLDQSRIIVTHIGGVGPDSGLMAASSAGDVNVRVYMGSDADAPNLLNVPFDVPGARRYAFGRFHLVPEDSSDPEICIGTNDRSLTSVEAARVNCYTLRYRDAEGQYAKVATLTPFGGGNRAGVGSLAAFHRKGQQDSLLVTAGPGASFGAHVKVYLAGTDGFGPKASYFAYGNVGNGCVAAAGDLDGDGTDEIVTGAGPGAVFGPHVRGWAVDAGTWRITAKPKINFFGYGNLRGGVNVATGDTDGDGKAEIITGAGDWPTLGGHVRAFSLDPSGRVQSTPLNIMLATASSGAFVAAADIDGDGRDEVFATLGNDSDGSIYEIGRRESGGYDVTESHFEDATSVTATPYLLMATRDGHYAGSAVLEGEAPWTFQADILGDMVTHLVVDNIVGACSGSAEFHTAMLPGGGAYLTEDGEFSFTALDDTGLITVQIAGKVTGRVVEGFLTLDGCGNSSRSYSAQR